MQVGTYLFNLNTRDTYKLRMHVYNYASFDIVLLYTLFSNK